MSPLTASLKALAEACPVDGSYRLVSYGGQWYIRTDNGIVFDVHRNRSFPEFVAINEAYANMVAVASPAAVLELFEEIEALAHWRELALQFDNHRMAALWHLKALLQSQEHAGVAHDFLDAPPMAGHEVVAERDQLKSENAALLLRIASDEKKLDALLNHCGEGECHTCGEIICPHGDGMHFHHDGCPACAVADEVQP